MKLLKPTSTGGQTDEAVQHGHQLRHLSHLDLEGQTADGAPPMAMARMIHHAADGFRVGDGGEQGDGHAAIPNRLPSLAVSASTVPRD